MENDEIKVGDQVILTLGHTYSVIDMTNRRNRSFVNLLLTYIKRYKPINVKISSKYINCINGYDTPFALDRDKTLIWKVKAREIFLSGIQGYIVASNKRQIVICSQRALKKVK